jgi:hypothetical protein
MGEDRYVWIMNLGMVKRRVGVELHCFYERLPLVSSANGVIQRYAAQAIARVMPFDRAGSRLLARRLQSSNAKSINS